MGRGVRGGEGAEDAESVVADRVCAGAQWRRAAGPGEVDAMVPWGQGGQRETIHQLDPYRRRGADVRRCRGTGSGRRDLQCGGTEPGDERKIHGLPAGGIASAMEPAGARLGDPDWGAADGQRTVAGADRLPGGTRAVE